MYRLSQPEYHESTYQPAILPEATIDLQLAPLLLTKLAPPISRPDLVPRSRLVARLLRGLDLPLTLIVAPTGYGKTTVVSQWLAAINASHANQSEPATDQPPQTRVAWLSLDAADDEPARFWRYLITALDHAVPGLGAGLATDADASCAMEASDPAITILLNRLSLLNDHLLLALDDYDQIRTDTIHQSLARIVNHMPRQFHLCLISQNDPPLPLARMRARDQLVEIRAHDLRFTSDEIWELLHQISTTDPALDLVADLEARTEGWAAGLHLTTRSNHDSVATESVCDDSHHDLWEYLEDAVLRHQPEDVREFLLATASLDELTSAACDELMGWDAIDRAEAPGNQSRRFPSRAMLDYLEQQNLFIAPIDRERRRYRYNRLFAETLRSGHQTRADGVQHHPGRSNTPVQLSEREIDVLRLLGEGQSNQEIAERLFITINTVKMHIKHIYDKLDVHNRVQALAHAHDWGLL